MELGHTNRIGIVHVMRTETNQFLCGKIVMCGMYRSSIVNMVLGISDYRICKTCLRLATKAKT